MPLLHIDATDATPIWSQIEEGIRRLVASGALRPGAPVPSVRELASELRINPATVARGYQRLAEDGILTVRRGDGTYVADAPPAMSKAEKTRILREGGLRYASLAATLGVSEDEAADALHGVWKKGIPS
jgi:GntR family transcriptional regulator